MDNLALYLLVSLFFVVGMMVQFAVSLLLYRRDTEKRCKNNQISFDGYDCRKEQKTIELERPNAFKRGWPQITSRTVDIIASISFPVAYIIFNIAYWASLY